MNEAIAQIKRGQVWFYSQYTPICDRN